MLCGWQPTDCRKVKRLQRRSRERRGFHVDFKWLSGLFKEFLGDSRVASEVFLKNFRGSPRILGKLKEHLGGFMSLRNFQGLRFMTVMKSKYYFQN